MKYKCENELNTLSFKEFGLLDINCSDGKFFLATNGGIAKYDNSCNETLEERYIGEAEIRIMDAKIEDFFLEGGKYFDAADKLIEEVPDKKISPLEYSSIFKKMKADESESQVYFVGIKSSNSAENAAAGRFTYEIAIDVINDTYWITVSGSKIIVEFDRFMNRVMA